MTPDVPLVEAWDFGPFGSTRRVLILPSGYEIGGRNRVECLDDDESAKEDSE